MSLLHGDIKLDNIMYDVKENHLKLIDFGLCVKAQHKKD